MPPSYIGWADWCGIRRSLLGLRRALQPAALQGTLVTRNMPRHGIAAPPLSSCCFTGAMARAERWRAECGTRVLSRLLLDVDGAAVRRRGHESCLDRWHSLARADRE